MDEIDFMKIDVEGEECNVLEGAAAFLARESPLLMIEFWGDKKFNDEIFSPLARHGYDCFRLVPGINVLTPFYESEEPDPYQLNLFACKPSRAAQLAGTGYLVAAPESKALDFACEPALDRLYDSPFARDFEKPWRVAVNQAASASATARHMQALRWFFAAQEKSNGAAARLWALARAYAECRSLLTADFTAGRAASFVRIAAAYGQRAEALEINRRLVTSIESLDEQTLTEPFLLPWRHQETLGGKHGLRAVLQASAVDSYEHLFQFSSSDKSSLAREALNVPVDERLLSPDYRRREALCKRRAAALAG
jgi:hypothetical protein